MECFLQNRRLEMAIWQENQMEGCQARKHQKEKNGPFLQKNCKKNCKKDKSNIG